MSYEGEVLRCCERGGCNVNCDDGALMRRVQAAKDFSTESVRSGASSVAGKLGLLVILISRPGLVTWGTPMPCSVYHFIRMCQANLMSWTWDFAFIKLPACAPASQVCRLDWESNLRPLGAQSNALTTEHMPGLDICFHFQEWDFSCSYLQCWAYNLQRFVQLFSSSNWGRALCQALR